MRLRVPESRVNTFVPVIICVAIIVTLIAVIASTHTGSNAVAQCSSALARASSDGSDITPEECSHLSDEQLRDAINRVVLGGLTGTGAPETPMPVSQVQWDNMTFIDGYGIMFTRPVDMTDKYQCPGCDLAIFETTVTITAGSSPLDMRTIDIRAYDANFSDVGITSIGDVTLPPGATRIARGVQLHVDALERDKMITIKLQSSHITLEWRTQ